MGTRNWHLARAKHHKKASEHMKVQFDDWSAVALFYSAMHYVHSSLADEATLPKDERNPRKHTGGDPGTRGTNQLVRSLYPQIYTQYMSLVEMSHRTRYDIMQLGPATMPMLEKQWRDVKVFCEGLNQGRPVVSSQQP